MRPEIAGNFRIMKIVLSHENSAFEKRMHKERFGELDVSLLIIQD